MHSEYVILISFPRQQWLRELAWKLLCSDMACLVTVAGKTGKLYKIYI